MGEVYLAEDSKLDRKVALKILPADVANHHDRFEQEAKVGFSSEPSQHHHDLRDRADRLVESRERLNTIWIDPEHDLVVVWRWHQDRSANELFKRILAAVRYEKFGGIR